MPPVILPRNFPPSCGVGVLSTPSCRRADTVSRYLIYPCFERFLLVGCVQLNFGGKKNKIHPIGSSTQDNDSPSVVDVSARANPGYRLAPIAAPSRSRSNNNRYPSYEVSATELFVLRSRTVRVVSTVTLSHLSTSPRRHAVSVSQDLICARQGVTKRCWTPFYGLAECYVSFLCHFERKNIATPRRPGVCCMFALVDACMPKPTS